MGNTLSDPCSDQHRTQLALACRTIEAPACKAATRLLLRSVPHAIFSDLPINTTACFVDDDCIGVLSTLVEEYCPNARIPYSAAEQWVEAASLQTVRRAKSAGM
jgi:hypothetical protein